MTDRWTAALRACAFLCTATPLWAQVTQPTTEAVTLTAATGVLSGTLTVPVGDGKHPLVVLVAGLGPTDRNGNTAGAPNGSDASPPAACQRGRARLVP